MTRATLFTFLISVLLSACSSQSLYSQNVANQQQSTDATLTGYQIKNGFITIKTTGYGCTFFNSFKVEVAKNVENGLTVKQVNQDKCGMKPRSVSLQYSFKHLGLDLDKEVKVTNPVAAGDNAIVKN